ncbi:rhodanese-like domain-containing protein [Moheibacter sp. BDHS18]|uniref:Rhodanese-like domain-containing protein n=2 Tax=Moheibacter lacus TaxID=2745851 RepID=A0A838ZIU3_9FLAO|nr:rhodanese-like domain-containing protein [Moheibacter lacus]
METQEISSVNEIAQIDFADENKVLLDVRTPEEFNAGNIPNSVNIDFNSDEFDAMIQDLDKEKTYYVYCKSGNRSTKASQKMQEAGFQHVVNLKDGYSAYQK